MKYTRGERMKMTHDGAAALIRTHAHDAASPQLANGPLRVAIFRPGTQAVCRCEAEGTDPAQCDALYVVDPDAGHFATFWGSEFRAAQTDATSAYPGGLCIYRMPQSASATQDARGKDGSFAATLNDKHAAFWAAPKDSEPTEQRRTFVEKRFCWQRTPE